MEPVVVDVTKYFRVTIHNRNIIDRVMQNQDGDGVPQPRKDGGDGWQDLFYQFNSEDELIEWLADCIGNRGYTLSRMDGFAELPDSDITVEQID